MAQSMALAGNVTASAAPSLRRHSARSNARAAVVSFGPFARTAVKVSSLEANSIVEQSFRNAVTVAVAASRVNMATGAYICVDCGYIYNKRPAFENLPDDWRCPVCNSPRRRFKPYTPPVERNANDTAVRKERKESLKKVDKALGDSLPLIVAVILAALVGAIVVLNSVY